MGENQHIVFSYYSEPEQTVKYFSKRGLDILKNGRGMFRAFILPHRNNNVPGEAVSTCRIPLKAEPMATDYDQQGRAFIEQRQYAAAQAVAEKMISQNAQDWRAYDLRGLSYFRRGQYEQAAQDYAKTLQLLPEHVYAHYFLGHCYEYLKIYGKARIEYKRFVAAAEITDPNVAVAERKLATLPQ